MSSNRGWSGAWHRATPRGLTLGLFLGLLATAGAVYYEAQQFTPLQSDRFRLYIVATVKRALKIDQSEYTMMMVENTRDKKLYYPNEATVELGRTVIPHGTLPFQVTKEAKRQGYRLDAFHFKDASNAEIAEKLRIAVYDGRSLGYILLFPLCWGLGTLAGAFVISIPSDRKRSRERREGRRLNGPELATVAAFNRKLRARGMGIRNTIRRTFFEWVLRRNARTLRIPYQAESSHLMLMGDSGTGKSVIIRQFAQQIEERGESAIIYDPALEYVTEFYDESRGDIILNPLDARMPYWSPADEIRHEAEALTVAASLFPDSHRENPFFVEGPRKVFAYLLTLKPSPDELVWWLSHEQELDKRLKGTELAAMIYPGAAAQRAGVLASLNMVADSLKMLPRKQEVSRSWTAVDWSKQRQGWIFLTSTPEVRKRLLPLTSLWLDLLVLRLMNQGRPGPRPVWFLLDELASLQRLPQLHTAITENRKSNNPVVLGFQGRSQLEARYGLDAEAMLSQPATKVFLRTSEPKSALWISQAIGQVEIELVRETRSDGRERNSRSYHLDTFPKPLVMDSVIMGLDLLHGYVKHGNLVVEFRTRPTAQGERANGFIPRKDAPPEPSAPSRTGPASGNNSSPAQELTPAQPEEQQSILEND
jgi:Type IV secretion-system coupling protein DNA-binding domain